MSEKPFSSWNEVLFKVEVKLNYRRFKAMLEIKFFFTKNRDKILIIQDTTLYSWKENVMHWGKIIWWIGAG